MKGKREGGKTSDIKVSSVMQVPQWQDLNQSTLPCVEH